MANSHDKRILDGQKLEENKVEDQDQENDAAPRKETAFQKYQKVSQVAGLGFDLLRFFGVVLAAIPFIRIVMNGISSIGRGILSVLGVDKKEGKWSRGIKAVTAFGTLGLGLAAIAAPVAAVVLGLTAMAVGIFQEVWVLSAALISRARGSWKKERVGLQNAENEFYNLLQQDLTGGNNLNVAENIDQNLNLLKVERDRRFEVEERSNNLKDTINRLQSTIDKLEKQVKSDNPQNAFIVETKKNLEEYKKTLAVYQAELTQLKESEKAKRNSPSPVQRLFNLDAKIQKSTNELRKRDADLASKVHGFALTMVAVAGVFMLATPLAPLGAILLLGTTIYGVMHNFDFPGKWASKISNFFFGPKKRSDFVDDNLRQAAKIKRENQKTNTLTNLPAASHHPELNGTTKKMGEKVSKDGLKIDTHAVVIENTSTTSPVRLQPATPTVPVAEEKRRGPEHDSSIGPLEKQRRSTA